MEKRAARSIRYHHPKIVAARRTGEFSPPYSSPGRVIQPSSPGISRKSATAVSTGKTETLLIDGQKFQIIHFKQKLVMEEFKNVKAEIRKKIDQRVEDEEILRPSLFISYAWGIKPHEEWVQEQLGPDIQQLGTLLHLDDLHNLNRDINQFTDLIGKTDIVVIVGTPELLEKYTRGIIDEKTFMAIKSVQITEFQAKGILRNLEHHHILTLHGEFSAEIIAKGPDELKQQLKEDMLPKSVRPFFKDIVEHLCMIYRLQKERTLPVVQQEMSLVLNYRWRSQHFKGTILPIVLKGMTNTIFPPLLTSLPQVFFNFGTVRKSQLIQTLGKTNGDAAWDLLIKKGLIDTQGQKEKAELTQRYFDMTEHPQGRLLPELDEPVEQVVLELLGLMAQYSYPHHMLDLIRKFEKIPDEDMKKIRKDFHAYTDYVWEMPMDPDLPVEYAIDVMAEKVKQNLDSIRQGIQNTLLAMASKTSSIEQKIAALEKMITDPSNNTELARYIPLLAMPEFHARQSLEDLSTVVDKFLQSDRKVLLLLGDSGSGKTMFTEWLEKQKWEHRKKDDPIVIRIELTSVRDPVKNALEEGLAKRGFTPEEIQQIKIEKIPVIVILEAYDEMRGTDNLWETNRLDEWNAKAIITCRSDYADVAVKQDRFMPIRHEKHDRSLFQKWILAPFSSDQINAYLERYVELEKTEWTAGQYRKQIELIPNLINLIENPFVAYIVARVLPKIVKKHEQDHPDEQLRLTKLDLFKAFADDWFERNAVKLERMGKTFDTNEPAEELFEDFSEKLAYQMQEEGIWEVPYKEKVSFDGQTIPDKWDGFFTEKDERIALIRRGCPLRAREEFMADKRTIKVFRFIHAMVQEYFFQERQYKIMTPQVNKELPDIDVNKELGVNIDDQ